MNDDVQVEGGGASRSTEPAAGSSTGTDVELLYFIESLRASDQRFFAERDRRYTERDILRAEALRIKEQADRDALGLAREIQTYKDEKANDLRAQIEKERGTYATQGDLKGAVEKIEATIKPISDYVTQAQGRQEGSNQFRLTSGALAAIVASIVGAISLVVYASHTSTSRQCFNANRVQIICP